MRHEQPADTDNDEEYGGRPYRESPSDPQRPHQDRRRPVRAFKHAGRDRQPLLVVANHQLKARVARRAIEQVGDHRFTLPGRQEPMHQIDQLVIGRVRGSFSGPIECHQRRSSTTSWGFTASPDIASQK
jgi:hypothetical protein